MGRFAPAFGDSDFVWTDVVAKVCDMAGTTAPDILVPSPFGGSSITHTAPGPTARAAPTARHVSYPADADVRPPRRIAMGMIIAIIPIIVILALLLAVWALCRAAALGDEIQSNLDAQCARKEEPNHA